MAAQKSFALTFEEMDRQRVHLFCILKLYKRTGLEEAKNKEGVEAIRKKYNEQRSEQV